MAVSKQRAMELIDDKIEQFKKLLSESYKISYGSEEYILIYDGTGRMLLNLFGWNDTNIFENAVRVDRLATLDGELPSMEERQDDFRRHISKCITQLKILREQVENFWEPSSFNLKEANEGNNREGEGMTAFIAKSFHKEDESVNRYFEGILRALNVKFETGERYSKECDVIIVVFVKRYQIIDGKFLPPSWLVREGEQKEKKDLIALVEKGIEDLAGLETEKELIRFDRKDIDSMEESTIKFLEALKEHGLA
ncbi:MAG: hypothetical protein M1163_05665 [Candidatus Thermoplasmatota archaeon]|nr:hypothetical protein [Candidatus Thermoplasmatota archaeon]